MVERISSPSASTPYCVITCWTESTIPSAESTSVMSRSKPTTPTTEA